MTTPFTNYTFRTTGAPTARTLPDRLAEIANVKDFGATGDGVTDDLAAIMAAHHRISTANRGLLYFPPGIYYVSGPIDISFGAFASGTYPNLNNLNILGHLGATTIIGNFPDYIITSGVPGDGNSLSGGHVIEKLTIINQHASGGGIRSAFWVVSAIRDCNIIANRGINTLNDDNPIVGEGDGAYFGSLDQTIHNCHFRAYDALSSNSFGIARSADGTTTNCSFRDFHTGVRNLGGEGNMAYQGCYFEHNNYGLVSDWAPEHNIHEGATSTGGVTAFGCHFKNNGVAILATAAQAAYSGILIEAAEGAIAGNPQYGVYSTGTAGHSTFSGIRIAGQYQVAGFALIEPHSGNTNSLDGVSVSNTSTLGGVKWVLPDMASGGYFTGCNVAPVYTMAKLPAFPIDIRAASWSSGITTLQLFFDVGNANGPNITVTVSGVSVPGFNGSFTGVTVTGPDTIAYAQSDPGGGPIISGGPPIGKLIYKVGNAAREGDCYNVSDADVSTWGGIPVGGGSNHVKLRWGNNDTAWTVAGK